MTNEMAISELERIHFRYGTRPCDYNTLKALKIAVCLPRMSLIMINHGIKLGRRANKTASGN